jgi:NAD(P)H-flavin reductase
MTLAIRERHVLEPAGMIPDPATIVSVRSEASGIATYEIRFDDPVRAARYRWKSGQFNMLWIPGFGECAISMSSDPGRPETVEHTIRFAGSVTRAIGQLRTGGRLGIRGPFGRPWPVDLARGNDLVLVAGGIGMAPVRPVIYEVLRSRSDFGKVTLLYGARTPRDLLYRDELDEWRKGGIELLPTVDRADAEWTGRVGVVPALIERLGLDPPRTLVFTCGPEVMIRFVAYAALARTVRNDAIWVSLERNMKCAIGLCGHCQLGPVFVCRDGPVFRYSEIEPFFAREEF